MARDLFRMGVVGDTDVLAAFCNPLMVSPPGRLVFFVSLDNHFGVPRSELAERSWVETSDGRHSSSGWAWEGGDLASEEHHIGGLLSGPLKMTDGSDLIGPGTSQVTLHLEGIGEGETGVALRWPQEHLR
ncbi:MAG: hypothetical protein HYZ28_05195 [Myxococcales bacterium]|nr:hypothetical protein [Myxococcales bacterium]